VIDRDFFHDVAGFVLLRITLSEGLRIFDVLDYVISVLHWVHFILSFLVSLDSDRVAHIVCNRGNCISLQRVLHSAVARFSLRYIDVKHNDLQHNSTHIQ
jgi:hypothetical protein